MILPISPIKFNYNNRTFKGFYDPAAGSPRTAMQERLIQAAKEAKEKAKQMIPDPNNIMHPKQDAFEHILPDGSLVTVSLDDLSKKSADVVNDGMPVVKTSFEKMLGESPDVPDAAAISGIKHILPDGMTVVDVPSDSITGGLDGVSDAVSGDTFQILKGDSLLEEIIHGASDAADAAADGISHILDAIGG